MQIRKTYSEVKPELLYDEVRDFILKQGAIVGEAKLETYPMPGDSSSFISRGILTFNIQDEHKRALDQLQKLTDSFIVDIEQIARDKEAELMEV